MRAVVYAQTGESDVLHLVDRPMPEPGTVRFAFGCRCRA